MNIRMITIRPVSYTHLDVYKRQEKSKAAGMDAHLAKPIEPERLFQTLYDFIFGKEA